ncbi:hypothetical protein TNCV_225081 [Trichonephila clavipes]|nr:hypothetical protein TNCV_225081 [Trichonephila clavipes]
MFQKRANRKEYCPRSIIPNRVTHAEGERTPPHRTTNHPKTKLEEEALSRDVIVPTVVPSKRKTFPF